MTPTMEWRGIHILVRSWEELPVIERLIATHMPQLHLNHLILEINYNFAYQSHPEVARTGRRFLTEGEALVPQSRIARGDEEQRRIGPMRLGARI